MKVTFFSPFYNNIWEPIGIAYIISYCKAHTNGVEFDFCHGNFDSTSEIITKCLGSDMVAMSATSPTIREALGLAKVIRKAKPEIRTVLGGWHPTAMSHYEEYPNIDDSIVGEGEQVMSLILNDVSDLDTWIESSGNYLEFAELPWPDRVTTKQERHLQACYEMCGRRIGSFQSRRGCPMSCAFCGEQLMSNHHIRVRDPEDLLDEIDYVNTDFGIDMFKFVDPTWCYPRTAAWEFCEAKLRRNNQLPWEAMGHAAFLSKGLLTIMKKASCKQINIGVESGNQEILNDMNKGVTIEKIKQVFKWCHDLDLEVRGFFLFGMPNDTLQTASDTFELIKEIKPDMFGMTILAPYPGSKFYDLTKHADVNWSQVDEYSNNIWETPNFTNADLKRVQRVFAKRFNSILAPHMKEVLKI